MANDGTLSSAGLASPQRRRLYKRHNCKSNKEEGLIAIVGEMLQGATANAVDFQYLRPVLFLIDQKATFWAGSMKIRPL